MKEFNLKSLVRKNLLDLTAYNAVRDSGSFTDPVYLEANENPYGKFNRYPDSQHTLLKEKIAALKSVETANIVLGNGSDELIDLIIRTFCEPNRDEILIMNPSFAMFNFYANINACNVQKLDMDDNFQINTDDFLEKSRNPNLKVVFLCSPNNPTGNTIENVEFFIQRFPGIVVVDEAYIDFTEEKSAITLLKSYPNLIVLQTLSKAYAMAGLRIGIGIASPEIVSVLQTVKPPYNISEVSQKYALEQLSDEAFYRDTVQKIKDEKLILKNELQKINCVKKLFPSQANFFLIEFEDAPKVYRFLLSHQVLTSNRHPELYNCLRINVGTPEENKNLLRLLNQFVNKNSEKN